MKVIKALALLIGIVVFYKLVFGSFELFGIPQTGKYAIAIILIVLGLGIHAINTSKQKSEN